MSDSLSPAADTTVALIVTDLIGERMAGPGIRYWEFCRILKEQFQLRLIVPPFVPTDFSSPPDIYPAPIVYCTSETELRQAVADCDVLVTLGVVLYLYPFLTQLGKPLVLDIYNPMILEDLERESGSDMATRLTTNENFIGAHRANTRSGDFFMCASEKQRDYWLGMLSALGRLNPYTHSQDPSLRRLIDVVPFGLPEEPAQHTRRVLKGVVPGIGENDRVILWGGGIWKWFDALSLIRAMPLVLEERDDVRLFFMGMHRSHQNVARITAVDQVLALTRELGLENRSVFFNDWVAYHERQNYLLEADLSASLHLDHVETRFAFRTRLLDCLWTGLPVIATRGDVMAETLAEHGLAFLVEPQDVAGVAQTILDLLDRPDLRQDCMARAAVLAPEYHWRTVTPAPGRLLRRSAPGPGQSLSGQPGYGRRNPKPLARDSLQGLARPCVWADRAAWFGRGASTCAGSWANRPVYGPLLCCERPAGAGVIRSGHPSAGRAARRIGSDRHQAGMRSRGRVRGVYGTAGRAGGAFLHDADAGGKVAGRDVVTVEGLAGPDGLHPLQTAFIETGAVQCGYCTPGVLTAAKGLLDHNPHPHREQILEALDGNLCRCTGYRRILMAVELAAARLRGETPPGEPDLERAVGGDFRRTDAVDKVTGRALYVEDVVMPGMLHARVLRCPYPHARLLALDVEPALQVTGVERVLTAADIPGENGLGSYSRNEPVLAEVGSTLKMVGAPLALVVAHTPQQAQTGVDTIRVEYEILPHTFDPEAALARDALPIYPEGNELTRFEIKHGDLERSFFDSELVLESRYQTAYLEHVALEREAVLGYIDAEGRVTVMGATHEPHWNQAYIAATLALPTDQVRFITPPMGGSFGGKQDPLPAVSVALAAYHLGQAVRLVYSRRESFEASPKRHPYDVRYRVGAGRERAADRYPGAHRCQHRRLRWPRAVPGRLRGHGQRGRLRLAGGGRHGPDRVYQRAQERPIPGLRQFAGHLCPGMYAGRTGPAAG